MGVSQPIATGSNTIFSFDKGSSVVSIRSDNILLLYVISYRCCRLNHQTSLLSTPSVEGVLNI
jgi:hypothetical protein